MRFEIIARMNTRSTSYSKTSVLATLCALSISWKHEGQIITAYVPDERRAEVEEQLLLIDRNIAYRKVFP